MKANTSYNDRKIELEDNHAYGIDLIIDKSSGGEMVRILTGKPENSFMFWQQLKLVSVLAIEELNKLKTTKCGECDEFVNDCTCK